MKRVVSAALLSAFLTGSALAADTVVNHDQAPVPAATSSFVWTGGFVGLNAGYAWGKSRYSNEYRDLINYDPDGWLGGLYAGYNHQFDNRLVLGIDADVNITRIKSSATPYTADVLRDDLVANSKIKHSGAIRGRVGYAADRFMPYIAGGVSFARYRFDAYEIGSGFEIFRETKTLTGWNVGAGVEYAATDNLILRAEYRYSDFGRKTFTQPDILVERARIDLKTHDVRFGIAYKF